MKSKQLIGLFIAALVVVAVFTLPVKEYMTSFLDWIQGVGPIGMVVFGLVYILACVFFLPGSILTIGAGVAWGVTAGTIAVSISSILGASAAFLLGRTLARDWITKKVGDNPKFNAVDEAVGNEGFKIVLLIRLSPAFPFNLLNYMFGLTKVSFWKHFFASWIGMLPGTIMYVALGAGIGGIFEEGGAGQKTLFYAGIAATVAVTVLVTRIAKRALAKAAPEAA